MRKNRAASVSITLGDIRPLQYIEETRHTGIDVKKTQDENGRASLGCALRGSSGFPPPLFLLQENRKETNEKKEKNDKENGGRATLHCFTMKRYATQKPAGKLPGRRES